MRVARREMGADVAIGQGAENRVGQGVQDHVAVRMGDDAAIMRNAHAAEPHMIAIAEGVHVEARAEAGHIGHRRAFHAPLRLREIGRMGELDVAGIALEHVHRQTGPFDESAIVGESRGDSRQQPGDALRAGVGKRKACGVCTARSAERSGVERTWDRSPITLIVSVTGVPGTAAPQRSAAWIARSIKSGPAKGRAASWIRTISGARSARASSPLRTESCLVSPPWTHGRTADEASGKAERVASYRSRSSGWITTIVRPMRGCATNAASVLARTGWPWSGRYCFGMPCPALDPRPAATMRAATDIRALFPTIALLSVTSREGKSL